jgi:hypothetical protein
LGALFAKKTPSTPAVGADAGAAGEAKPKPLMKFNVDALRATLAKNIKKVVEEKSKSIAF